MEELLKKWDDILEFVKDEYQIKDISFNTWVKPLRPSSIDGDKLYILVPQELEQTFSYIKRKFYDFIVVAIIELTGINYKVEFILEEQAKAMEPAVKKMVASKMIEKTNLNQNYTFETFVVGSNNRFAHAASLAVAESPGEVYNPLFIHGGVGLGKTHLMHSVAHYIIEHNPDLKVLYVSSETFTNEVIESIRNGNSSSMSQFRNKYRNIDVLLVDDVQFIIGKDATQEEFFHTFNELHLAKKQIILSSDRPPKEMETLEDRIRSRFECGLLADIGVPDYETRMAILKRKQETDGISINDDILSYIAANIKSNVRELEGALNRLVAYANLEKVQISMEIAQRELQNIISTALKNFLGEPLYYFSPSERTYSILLQCTAEEEKDYILKVSNAVLQLHDYMLDTYDIWLFAGIGRNTDSLMNVWESHQQATEAVSYTTKNYIFYPYEFIKKKSDVFYYPPEISTKLIHFISSGNTAQVLELFNLIHQENIEERSLPINLLKYLLSDIRNTLLKARFALPSNADPEAVKKLDERFNEHLSFKLCEDLALSLCTLFTNESDDDNLAVTIEKYIAANYMDPSMGLNKISDEFQISESYFSHMFKEKTGVNFSTYLENIRMTEAVRLIKETDTSLNELYIAVGYNNANSFRRAFKKVYGVTPSSMRDSAK